MRMTAAHQVSMDEVLGGTPDLILAASGFETRARYVPELLRSKSRSKRSALGFTDRPVLSRANNDKRYQELGYTITEESGDSDKAILQILDAQIRAAEDGRMTAVVDYTSMTRVWYASVLRFFADTKNSLEEVTLYFTYTAARFSKPLQPGPNMHMGPIRGFSGLSLPERGTALVIGLGYEEQRASGLVEYVEGAETYAFLTDPALDQRFQRAVTRNNAAFLAKLAPDHVIPYPLADLDTTALKLTSLCLALREQHRVILAPLGPKPFGLLCLLFAATYSDVDVWRVSGGQHTPPADLLPSRSVMVEKVTFSQ